MMINRLLRIMWPKLTESIFKMVIGVVKPMVQDMLNKVGVLCLCWFGEAGGGGGKGVTTMCTPGGFKLVSTHTVRLLAV
jgi:hypothetical protein